MLTKMSCIFIKMIKPYLGLVDAAVAAMVNVQWCLLSSQETMRDAGGSSVLHNPRLF